MATIEPRTLECKSGTCLIRSAALEDAPELLKLQHRLCSETEFLSRKPTEITLTVDQQRQRIADATAAERGIFCVAVVSNQIVGSTRRKGQSNCEKGQLTKLSRWKFPQEIQPRPPLAMVRATEETSLSRPLVITTKSFLEGSVIGRFFLW
jgi:hypothetical protein